MYSAARLASNYFRYFFNASNGKGHGMHSPFVFEFIKQVLNDKTEYEDYKVVEALRSQLLKDTTVLDIQDMGAGSAISKTSRRSVASIARNAAKPKKFGQLLYRMARYYQPATIIEMGTSLGITTAYLAKAAPQAKLVTMEGSLSVAEMARKNFRQLDLSTIQEVQGNFDETLAGVLDSVAPVDFVFIDGNHRLEPTLRYFQQLLPLVKNDTILVFDDIHWSAEMEAAWKAIQAHEDTRCTIDLFFIGIVLFRQEFREKQHFTIRF